MFDKTYFDTFVFLGGLILCSYFDRISRFEPSVPLPGLRLGSEARAVGEHRHRLRAGLGDRDREGRDPLSFFPSPRPTEGRVLLRPPKPQRYVGGGQPGGAGFGAAFGAGFCPAPPKIHRNLQI